MTNDTLTRRTKRSAPAEGKLDEDKNIVARAAWTYDGGAKRE
jgi:hypothetical protein